MLTSRLPTPAILLLLTGCFPEVDLTVDDLVDGVGDADGGGGEGGGDDGGGSGGDEGGGDEGGGDDGGEVVVGQLVVSPTRIDEGLVFIGTTQTTEVYVTNVGPGTAEAELVLAGEAAGSWSLDSSGATMEAGDTTTFVLSFTPDVWGALTAEVVVTDLVSSESSSISLVAEVQEDADGDGVGSLESGGEDCDDADAYVHPGAEETWYDGTDADCMGDDDYDADGDGDRHEDHGGTDCDDADDTVYGGAIDTWYDGIDSDCAGDDDYDADGDGAQADAYGGTDCDDSNASVSPDARESWYDGTDQDCDGASDYDADGDGYDSDAYGGTDCDDADAGTNPGASETWYDGTDADCAGDDDYDADADGEQSDAWGGTDCDDTDSSVNTSATETWYDGTDQDCDGASDYDRDGDGVDSSAWGGKDCDDGDAAVNPSATEVWYDGTDQDCDGASDYDADGDGYDSDDYSGTDCDDTDSSVNPGATETWYDGTDQDCDGASDYDADGDGYDSDDHGGTDCDDTDASITAPVDETLNGLDDDCNGDVDDLYVADAEAGIVYGYEASMAVGNLGTFMITDDVTDDGDVELIVLTSELDYGYVWGVEASDLSAANDDLDAVDTIYGEGYWYAFFPEHAASVSGDFDDDGVTDLLFGTEGAGSSYGDYGFVYAYTGGTGIAGTLNMRSADGGFSGDDWEDDGSQITIADVDGDGVDDAIMGGRYDGTDKGKVGVFLGGSSISGVLYHSDADETITGTSDYDEFGTFLTSGDLDGDGYDDFVATAPGDDDGASDGGAVHLIMGNSSASWKGKADDADSAKIRSGSTNMELGEDFLPAPGDVDGDGDLDLLIPDEDNGKAWLFLDAGSLSNVALGKADHTFSGSTGDFATAAVIDSDLDDDGDDDIVIGADSADITSTNSGGLYIYMYDSSWSSSLGISDADGVIWGDDSGDYLGTGLFGGFDLNGDGIEDIVAGAVGVDDSASNGGALYLIPGW